MTEEDNKLQRLVDSRISAHYMNTVGEQGRMQNRITKLEDKGVEQVIVDTIGPMLDRLTELEERNIGYKQDIVLLTQENSQMFERITLVEEKVEDILLDGCEVEYFPEPAELNKYKCVNPKCQHCYEQVIHEEQLQPVNNDYSSPRTEDKIYANPHKDKISATSDKPEPAMEEWIEVDGKMYSRTEAAGRIEALEKELRYLQTASQAKIYNGPS